MEWRRHPEGDIEVNPCSYAFRRGEPPFAEEALKYLALHALSANVSLRLQSDSRSVALIEHLESNLRTLSGKRKFRDPLLLKKKKSNNNDNNMRLNDEK